MEMADPNNTTENQPSHGLGEQTGIDSQPPQQPGDGHDARVQQRHSDEHPAGEREGHGHNVGAYRGDGAGERTIVGGIPGHIRAQRHGENTGPVTGHGHDVGQVSHGDNEHPNVGGRPPMRGTERHYAGSLLQDMGRHRAQPEQSEGDSYPEPNALNEGDGNPSSGLLDGTTNQPGTPFQPVHSLVRPDGVLFPVLFQPGQLVNPLYMPSILAHFQRVAPGATNIQADMLNHRVHHGAPMVTHPGNIHTGPAAHPNNQLSSPAQGEMPRVTEGAHGQSFPVSQNMVPSGLSQQEIMLQQRVLNQQSSEVPTPRVSEGEHGQSFPATQIPVQSSGLSQQEIMVMLQQPAQDGNGQPFPATQNSVQSSGLSQQEIMLQQHVQGGNGQSPGVPTPNQSLSSSSQGNMLQQPVHDGHGLPVPAAQTPNQPFGHPQSGMPSGPSQGGQQQAPPTAPTLNGSSGRSLNGMVYSYSPNARIFRTDMNPAYAYCASPQRKMRQPRPPPRRAPTPAEPTTYGEFGSSTNPLGLSFEHIRAGTAKCDVCNQRNRDGMTRCKGCGWQSCHDCTRAGGYARRHMAGGVHHHSPISEGKLIPLHRLSQSKSMKRKEQAENGRIERERAKNGTGQVQSQTGATPDETNERQPDASGTNERHSATNGTRPAEYTIATQATGSRANAPAKRKQAESQTKAPKAKAQKTTNSEGTKDGKSKPGGKPAAKEDQGNDKANEGAQATGSAALPSHGSPSNDQPSDTESVSSSVIEGARALCEFSADAFRLFGQENSQAQADAAGQTAGAPRRTSGICQRQASPAAASGQNGAARNTSGSSRRVAGSASAGQRHAPGQTAASRRVASSAQLSTRRHSQQRYAEDETDDYDDDRDEDYDDDTYGAESDESSVGEFVIKPKPQMLGSKPPGEC